MPTTAVPKNSRIAGFLGRGAKVIGTDGVSETGQVLRAELPAFMKPLASAADDVLPYVANAATNNVDDAARLIAGQSDDATSAAQKRLADQATRTAAKTEVIPGSG